MIRSRQLLPCPDMCPPRMYGLMVECWGEMPQRRPHFDELNGRLKQLLLPILPQMQQLSNIPVFPFAGSLSCASNNSQSSHHSHNSSNTGPVSNNTNSTTVSNMGHAWSHQQRPQQSPSHCVAYQSTPIVHCPINCQSGGTGRYSPQQHPNLNHSAVSTPVNLPHTHHPQYHGNTPVRFQQSFHPGRGGHSHSPYRVLMESKATNI